MHTHDIELTRFADFRPTAMDPRGLGADSEDPASPEADQSEWLIAPVSRCPHISRLGDDSNWETQEKCVEAVDLEGRDHEVHYFGHWATPFEILVVRPGSPAHRECQALAAALADYPLLDDSDHSEREYEATCDNIQSELRSLTIEREGVDVDPSDLAGELFTWFWEHDQSAVESRDDQGGWPSAEQVSAALTGLGYALEDGTWRSKAVAP